MTRLLPAAVLLCLMIRGDGFAGLGGALGRRQVHRPGRTTDKVLGGPLLTAAALGGGGTEDAVVVGSTAGLPQPEAVDALEAAKVANLPRSYLVLAVLLLTFASNQWARQALYYLCDFSASGNPVEHINVALGFDKEMYAALASFGFTIVFALVSLFAGGVSDSTDRSRLAGVSCLVWSAATALQSQARGFADLVPLRAVIGASQAFYNPAAYTLLADIFPKNMVGTVNGIFSSGVYLGGALASLSILLDRAVGWRATLQCVGAVGVAAAALVVLLVPEPRAAKPTAPLAAAVSASSGADESSVVAAARFDASAALAGATASVATVLQSHEARLLFSAATLRFCAGFSIGIWKAPFVFAKFAGNEAAFAGSNAFIVAVGGLLSSLLGGYLSDRLANPSVDSSSGMRARPRARAWVPAVGSLLAAPLWAAFCLTDSATVAAGVLFLEYLVAECWFGECSGTVQLNIYAPVCMRLCSHRLPPISPSLSLFPPALFQQSQARPLLLSSMRSPRRPVARLRASLACWPRWATWRPWWWAPLPAERWETISSGTCCWCRCALATWAAARCLCWRRSRMTEKLRYARSRLRVGRM